MLDDEISLYLQLLPEFMRNYIVKFKKPDDQKARLIARLMLKKILKETGNENLINDWKNDSSNKPFIYNWSFFNITHSNDIVLFASSDFPIGIDIEKISFFDYNDFFEFLHTSEYTYISNAEDSSVAFFEIWTKKEAFLKAIGTGLVNQLKMFNCIDKSIIYLGENWFFHNLNIHPGYNGYICNQQEHIHIKIIEFSLPS